MTMVAALSMAHSADAATEKFVCQKGTEPATTVELDRDGRTLFLTEGGSAKLDRQPVCAAIAKMIGDIAKDVQPRCTVVYGTGVIVADYVYLEGADAFNVMVALDSGKLMLSTIARIGTDVGMVDASACKRS